MIGYWVAAVASIVSTLVLACACATPPTDPMAVKPTARHRALRVTRPRRLALRAAIVWDARISPLWRLV